MIPEMIVTLHQGPPYEMEVLHQLTIGEVKGAPEKIIALHQSLEQHEGYLEELEVVHQFPEPHMKAPENYLVLHQSPEEIEVLPPKKRIPEKIVTV